MNENILTLDFQNAKKYFLETDSYFNLEFPKYFDFSKLLNEIEQNLNGDYKGVQKLSPSSLENVNYKLLHNKDGKYAWRPYELIHPVIYVSLVNQITKEENWNFLKKRIKKIEKSSQITAFSLPLIEKDDRSKKERQIENWWNEIEQKSIALGLDYQYIFSTDITDCYSSIYTHSIAWAIHSKKIAKREKNNASLLGNIIDQHLQAMSHGQTNGIPQGSSLMDFIAELVLYYADEMITKKINENNYNNFKIIRYRDDYRIFVNDSCLGENILKIITEILSELGLKVNSLKTNFSNNIIKSSIKEDKIEWIKINNEKVNIQKQLLLIHEFSLKYPNSGTIIVVLNKLQRKINKMKSFSSINIETLISIVTDIAYRNSRTYPVIAAILSKFFSLVKKKEERSKIIKKVVGKLNLLPNTEYFDIWFQRAILVYDEALEFNGVLCKIVNQNDTSPWNNEWINSRKINQILRKNEIINKELIEKIEPIIANEEISIFIEHKKYL